MTSEELREGVESTRQEWGSRASLLGREHCRGSVADDRKLLGPWER